MSVNVIAVDGLHNNGKTTHVLLLKEFLDERGYYTVVRRGDGSRKGLGEEIYDPHSQWWQDNRERILAAGFEGEPSHIAAVEAANRLNRELLLARDWWLPKEMKHEGADKGIILLDRSHISRLFVYRRFDTSAGFEEISQVTTSAGESEVVIPDLTLLLHAPLTVLHERNFHREDTAAKIDFNNTVLTKYYAEFEEHISNLPTELTRNLVRINTSPVLGDVQAELQGHVVRFIERQRVHPELLA